MAGPELRYRPAICPTLEGPMNDPVGKTLLTIPPVGAGSGPRSDELYLAVRDAVAESYLLLGELGRGRQGSVVYLVRDRSTTKLVALKLDRTPGTESEYALTVAPQLDESIPSPGANCPFCNSQLAGWVQFCGRCGRDVSGVNSGVSGFTPEQLLDAVHAAAQGTYEVLGEMQRASGGGVVYFAKDLASEGIVALRLQRDASSEDGEFSLGRTSLLKPLVEAMGAEYASPTLLGESPAPAQRQPAQPPPPRLPQPVDPSAARRVPPPAAGPPQPAKRSDVQRPKGGDMMRTEVLSSFSESETPAPANVASQSDSSVSQMSVGGAPLRSGARPTSPRKVSIALAIAGAAVVLAAGVAMATLGGGDENALDESQSLADTVTAVTGEPASAPALALPAQATTTDSAVLVVGRLPNGARVFVDGALAHRGSNTMLPGRHTLVVRAPGFEQFEETKELPAGTTKWTPRLRAVVVAQKPQSGRSDAAPAPPNPPAPARATCASASAAKEWERARSLCREAAATGSAIAQRTLGMLLLRGNGGSIDEAGGINALRLAANADDAEAQFQLGRAYQTLRAHRNNDLAYQFLRKAAGQGHPEAQYHTGLALERGIGTKRNYAEAYLWCEQAAKQGHIGAFQAMGVYLKKGQGVARDERKALELLTRAAEGGNVDAYYHIGELHEKGLAGLPRSREAARDWYQKGTALGSEEAKRAFDRLR